jgi:hypothetical protein
MWNDSWNERNRFSKNDLKMEAGCAPKVWFLCTGLHLDAVQVILTPVSTVYFPPAIGLK